MQTTTQKLGEIADTRPKIGGENQDLSLGSLNTTSPDINLQQPCAWMKACLETHEACGLTDSNPLLPSRVLDIGQDEQDTIRLCEFSDGTRGSYAALSHCWGKSQPLTLSHDTMESRRTGIDPELLPKVFLDAVVVARSLGLQYLWIDSLCIIQGDEEDWAREAPKMGSVYSNAPLVIAASSAKSSSDGFLNSRVTGDIIGIPYPDRSSTKPSFYLQEVLQTLVAGQDILEDEPLFSRSWVMQERYFATRMLAFATHQMVWECKSICQTEDGRHEDKPAFRLEQVDPTRHRL
jgi:hypothetical protein